MFSFKLIMTVFILALFFWGEFWSLNQIFQIIQTAKLQVWEAKFRDKNGTLSDVRV